MLAIALIALLLFGASVVLIARAVALPRLRAADRLRGIEAYGFRAVAASTAPERSRLAFGDVANRIGELLATRLRSVRPEDLRRELLAAGMYRVSAQTLLGYRFLAAVAIGALGMLVFRHGHPGWLGVFTALFALAGWMLPVLLVRRRARSRMAAIERELPDMIDLLVVTVEAGVGLAAALQLAVTKFDGPLADEVRLAMQEQRMGRSLADALTTMLGRADTPGMRSFVRSITQGEAMGVGVGTIMRNLAEEMRKRRRAIAEEQAQKAPVKILFPLVFLILPALLIVILGPALFNLVDSLGS